MTSTHPKIRVLTYNIHKGFSMGNRRNVLKQIRDAIRVFHADLVFLQEVHGHTDRTPVSSQFEFLADEIWPHFAYGKNAVYSSGHHGNAILSKYPIHFSENIDVSTNRLERRGLLHAVIHVPHKRKPVHAICVHLGLLETERKSQLLRLCERIDAMVPHSEPLLIGGDFNDWGVRLTSLLEKKVEARELFVSLHGTHARTFPSWLPTLKLDRIYYRGLKPIEAFVLSGAPWNRLSDHVALGAELAY